MKLLRKAWKSFHKRAFKAASVVIAAGPAQGMKVSAVVGPEVRAGTYEGARMAALADMIQPGDVFWDIGAHIGYVTLIAASRVGPAGSVVAFEPWPSNRAMLERNLRLNALSQVIVRSEALSSAEGAANFGGGKGSGTKGLGGGHLMVPTRRGDGMVAEGLPAPTVLKMDVEGHETEVLRGLPDALGSSLQVLLIAVHNQACFDDCQAILRSAGFDLHIPERSYEIEKAGFPPRVQEAEILAIRPGRTVGADVLDRYMAD